MYKTIKVIFIFSGDQVMGKVFMNSFHELGSAFHVSIEKVFLCMGRDGYVPNYDPRNKQYGCAGPRPNLLHSLKILVSIKSITEELLLIGHPDERPPPLDRPLDNVN